jgi:Lipopolysaccharide-assembly
MCPESSTASSRHNRGAAAVRRALALMVALSVVAPGCGYSLRSDARSRFSDPQVRIDLAPFSNDTADADAGAYVAARLREEMRRGGFGGTFGRAGADFLVEGKVHGLPEEVFSHGPDRFALENRLTVVVDIRVVDVRGGGVLWKAAGLRETASFFAGPDAQYTEANRRAAFEETVHRLVVRIAQTIQVVL